MLAAVPRHLGCLGAFADDLSLEACFLFSAMFALGLVFRDMAFASSLRMQGKKMRLPYLWGLGGGGGPRGVGLESFSEVQLAKQDKHLRLSWASRHFAKRGHPRNSLLVCAMFRRCC